jgi:hypothetical protein
MKKTGPPDGIEADRSILRIGIPIAFRLLQQGQNVLRVLVGDRENGDAGLRQDLRSGQVGRFGGEVGVRNGALRIGQVG